MVATVTPDIESAHGASGWASAYQPRIRDMPQGERPRERLREYGPRYLSNAELIAILLRTGVQGENVLAMSNRLLSRFGGLDGLGRANFAELCAERGLSEAKASQLLASLELGRRFISLAPQDRAVINSPQDVANLLQAEMATLEQEHLRALLLNTKNQVINTVEVYVGNVNSSIVRPSEVFRPAVRDNAPSIIVVHNHPSGDPTPSPEDVAITRELVSAGKLLGIDLLDHVVIGSGGRYVSLNERRLGFE
ncbi:MAG: JAB domain-containing protein [Chloroflexi bacterium]|nr:JAB domain-containing protein [Chloroflexota bacterium]